MNQMMTTRPAHHGSLPEHSAAPRHPPRVAFVHAQWHADIVLRGRDAFLAELARHRIPAEAVDSFPVPGAFEIPLHARQLAGSGHYDAIVACALVVDGGIYRHEFVADAVISGLMRVQLDTGIPVISAVLTPRHFHAHAEHQRFFAEHFVVKGTEAAQACLQTVESLARLAERFTRQAEPGAAEMGT
jgi:6,7-dimethyl-8-ribityllumazine synthase